MYQIVKAPNEILRTATQPVELPADKLAKIIAEMKATLVAQTDPEGVGLAANQVNLPYNLFLARFDTKKDEPVHIFVNPEIVAHSDELQPEDNGKKPLLEGCLSLPNYYGVVKRYLWVQIKYQNEKFETKNEKFEGFPATVIQHEMDHLNGKIFVEKILEQNGKLFKTKTTKGKHESWEEVEI